MDLKETNLVLKIIEYSINKDTVTTREIYRDLKLSVLNQRYVQLYLLCSNHSSVTSNHILAEVDRVNIHDSSDYKYKLLPSAVFQYVDYLEIKEARKNAKHAFILSIIAIVIALWQTIRN